MATLIPSRMLALAILAAIAVALATPAFAVTYDRNGAGRGDFVDSGCMTVDVHSYRAWCDLARH